MYCEKCGAKRTDQGNYYCPECGNKFNQNSYTANESQSDNDFEPSYFTDDFPEDVYEYKSMIIKRKIAFWMSWLLIPFFIIYRLLFWEEVHHTVYTDYYNVDTWEWAETRATGSEPYNHLSTLGLIIGIVLVIVLASTIFRLITSGAEIEERSKRRDNIVTSIRLIIIFAILFINFPSFY